MKESFAPPPAKLGLGLILLSLLFVISCEDQTLNDEQPLSNSKVINQRDVAFATENLSIYGASLLTFQKDSDFRKVLYAGIEAAFDGERNVLFKTLLQEDKNPIHARKLTSSLLGSKEGIMNAFANIEGKNYYPQLFIPFYDELKANGKLSIKDPVLVIYATDSPNSEYQGYSINNNGDLVKTKMVSEAYAKENEVWVVSLNERVDSEGNVINFHEKETGGRTQGVSYPNARFATIKIDSHKEEWVSGGSEVHIKRYASFYRYDQYSSNQAALNYTEEDALNDGDGWRIKEIKRKDVGKTLTVNWVYAGNWPDKFYNFDNGTSYHTDYLYYVVFEYDPWPAGMRTASIQDAGLSSIPINSSYRSTDTFYKIGYIPEYGANYWTSSTGFHFTSEY